MALRTWSRAPRLKSFFGSNKGFRLISREFLGFGVVSVNFPLPSTNQLKHPKNTALNHNLSRRQASILVFLWCLLSSYIIFFSCRSHNVFIINVLIKHKISICSQLLSELKLVAELSPRLCVCLFVAWQRHQVARETDLIISIEGPKNSMNRYWRNGCKKAP